MPCLFYDSPIGPMTLVQEGEALARLDFDVPSQPEEATPLLLEACRQLREYFAPDEVDLLYINFCDPWPSHKHARRRLTGDHVPYPIEAWPEGSQRHLAAESGLFCRVVTEGLFGIRPTGLRTFECTPSMPSGWKRMALRHIRAFGNDFDLEVERIDNDHLSLRLAVAGQPARTFRIRQTETLQIRLPQHP